MQWLKYILLTMHMTGAAMAAPRPNVVILFADDLGRYAGAYADPDHPSPNDIIDTPVFDRIAREGALFNNAFVSAPSCTPSRAALHTGRHFFRNGSHSQLHHPWDGDPQTDPFREVIGIAAPLRKAGYAVGYAGKVHVRDSLIGGKEVQFNGAGRDMNRFSQLVAPADDPASAKAAILEQIRRNFRAFLETRARNQPIYYSLHPMNTHRKWVRGSGSSIWGLDPDNLKGRLPPYVPDVPEVREDFADYLGEAMAFDAYCGVILEELERLGELGNTLFVISGDHGAPGFPRGKANVNDFGSRVLLAMRWPGSIEPGRVIDTPVSLVDLAPTFADAAGVAMPEDIDGESLLPVLRRGGDEDALRGWALIGREVHDGTAREGLLPYPVRALRTREFLYVVNFKPDRWPAGDPNRALESPPPPEDLWARNTFLGYGDIDASPTKGWLVHHREAPEAERAVAMGLEKRPREELYDLRRDPDQLHNLAGDPEYAPVRERMNRRLMDLLRRGEDPRLTDAFDRPFYLKNKSIRGGH
ncbi:sulfatase [Kiritimatiella glycovorans]|uniref:Arylsulfatase n=1 Tax=Kiritimatiella glycovorans TaxID=1307763 RepID=A0A0G3EHY5_9BACT|nr:sulfatase [Kiritimatiella glycovorans]AKJ63794.1 Arylsulfatase [Kiritimatiella glycovorans]